MTTLQDAIDAMSHTSVSFFKRNEAIIAIMPNLPQHIASVENIHGQIYVAKVLQEAEHNATNTGKKQLRKSLITSSINMDRRIAAYATNTGNSSLLEQVGNTESRLNRLSDQKLIRCCQVIHDSASANAANLAAYSITEAMISEQQTLIDNFSAAIPQKRLKTTDSGKTTKLLASLFKALLDQWAKIDTLVEMVRDSKPEFYYEYHKVRKVIVLGKGSLTLKVRATNAQTGGAEANVTLTLTPATEQAKAAGANGKSSVVKKTAAGGGSYYKSVADGIYTVTAKKPGFRNVVETVSVVNGEMTVLEIKMEKA